MQMVTSSECTSVLLSLAISVGVTVAVLTLVKRWAVAERAVLEEVIEEKEEWEVMMMRRGVRGSNTARSDATRGLKGGA